MLLVRAVRQAAWLDARRSPRCPSRQVASGARRLGSDPRGAEPYAGATVAPRGLPDCAGPCFRHGRNGNGTVVTAGGPRRRRTGLGELWQRVGHRYHLPVAAGRRARLRGPVRGTARPRPGRFRPRCGVRLERHDVWRVRSGRSVDRQWRGAGDLRRDIGGVGDAGSMEPSRCRHVFLAEGHGRGSPARHPDSVATCRRTPGVVPTAVAAPQDLSHGEAGPRRRGAVPRRYHQHPVAPLRGRCPRFVALDRRHWRGSRNESQKPGKSGSSEPMGRRFLVGRFPCRPARDPLLHIDVFPDHR